MTLPQLTVKRVIKFRFWDTKNLIMAQVDEVFGSYEFIKDGDRVRSDLEMKDIFNGDYPEIISMQFIGLTDKNRKEVYEGDRIRIYWRADDDFTDEIISYDEKYCYFKYGNNPICELFDPETPFEVIGNIYEPPIN